jgi:hypothetical protein
VEKNNISDETCLNDIVMEEERMEGEFEIQSSLQTKKNTNANEGKEKMNLKNIKMETR